MEKRAKRSPQRLRVVASSSHATRKEIVMSEQLGSEQLSSERRPRRRGRAIAGVLIVALAGGLVGAFAGQSFSQGFGPAWHMTVGGPIGGPLTPQQMTDRADRMVRHVAIELDASAEQQAKLEAIVKSAVGDLVPMRDKMLAARAQMRDLLTQTTIDRGAIEKLRAEQIATVDALSKRIAQAVGDAAEVLTPDQRRKLGDMLPPAGGGYWHPWHRG
jgi:Spy/CpxP family protein refolding chaperone